jgi:hypothetical protein
MPRNICLAFTRFGVLFLPTSSVSADRLFIVVRLLAIQQPGNTLASTEGDWPIVHIAYWRSAIGHPRQRFRPKTLLNIPLMTDSKGRRPHRSDRRAGQVFHSAEPNQGLERSLRPAE